MGGASVSEGQRIASSVPEGHRKLAGRRNPPDLVPKTRFRPAGAVERRGAHGFAVGSVAPAGARIHGTPGSGGSRHRLISSHPSGANAFYLPSPALGANEILFPSRRPTGPPLSSVPEGHRKLAGRREPPDPVPKTRFRPGRGGGTAGTRDVRPVPPPLPGLDSWREVSPLAHADRRISGHYPSKAIHPPSQTIPIRFFNLSEPSISESQTHPNHPEIPPKSTPLSPLLQPASRIDTQSLSPPSSPRKNLQPAEASDMQVGE
jgi:hypothetical protein